MLYLTEDAHSDLHQNLVARMLLTMMNEHFKLDQSRTHWGARALRIGGVEVSMFPGSAFGWSGPYEALHVIFGPVQGRPQGGSGVFQDGRPFIRLDWFLEPTDVADCIAEFLHDPHAQSTTLHELIHFLDALRNPTVHDDKDHSADETYYNSPEEFNAFFHNVADGLLNFIQVARTGLPEDYLARFAKAKRIDRNFTRTIVNLLDQTAENHAVQGFLNHLNDRNNRSLLKRLYKLHQEALPYL
jgi:hypothetical protein